MPRLALALALALATCCLLLRPAACAAPQPSSAYRAPLAPTPAAHIFLVAGQSNSVGYNTDPFTAEDAVNPRILQLSCCTANLTALPPARCFLNVSSDPLQRCAAGSHVSFARSFARSLLPSLPPGDVVVLVPTGISGTGFIDGVWPAYTGSGFKAAVASLQRAWQLLAADAAYGRRSFDGVLWHQGTLDAGDNAQHVAANASYHLHHNLIPLIAALRNTSLLHFTHPALPFTLSQMLPSWMDNATHPERQGVKAAIAMLTQYVPYTGFADSYGLLGDPVFLSGSDHEVIHFTARSQRILGKRYYAAYQAALVNYPEQPPAGAVGDSDSSMRHARRAHGQREADVAAEQPAIVPSTDLTHTTFAPAPQPTTFRSSSPSAALLPAIGVCLSGLEDGNRVPGVPGVDYAIPAAWEYEYFASKRLTMVRLPFKWERIQPALSGPLDPYMLGVLKAQLAVAAALNMTVLLDCHNYARYGAYVINGTTGPLTSAVFADLWLRLATEFAGARGLHGYDLMNEPNTMPDLHVWPQAAQAAIDAIRTVDKHTAIYVEGNQWSGAAQWTQNNPDFPLTDPSDRVVYSTHCYLDRDGSGTHFNWTQEEAHGVNATIGVQRLSNFVAWKERHGVRGHLGEMGAGYDSAGWFDALDRSLAVVQAAGMEMTYWGAGPFFLDYPMGVDVATVQGRQQDKRQMAVLTKYAQSAPTRDPYWLAGPTAGRVGTASGGFMLEVRAYLPRVVSFACYDGVSGEAFWSVSSAGHTFNFWVNFTYTAAVAGQYQIFCVNDAGWIDAPAIVYTAK